MIRIVFILFLNNIRMFMMMVIHIAGNVVVFLSAGVGHQVRPVHSAKCRMALAAWCY